MEEEPSHMTQRILTLTLEIIYLLTGEHFPLVKSGDLVTFLVPPPHSLKPDINNKKKILEVTNNIIELLTGEVPIRRQDVAVYFSMAEWEYLEGHKELYKDVMMASQPALTSPDGSVNGKPPERCPPPLYSHRDSTQEDQNILHHHQGEDVMNIKVEDEVEGMYVRDAQQYTEEEKTGMMRTFIEEDTPTQISTIQGWKMRRSSEDCLTFSAHCDHVEDEDITHNSLGEEPHTQHVHPVPRTDHGPSHYSYPEEVLGIVRDGAVLQANKRFPCSKCRKCLHSHSALPVYEQSHAGEKPYSCSECVKCFLNMSHLSRHQRSHTGDKLYSCSECGKCFSYKSSLSIHRRSHTGEKPFSCSECGKCFSLKSSLSVHQRSHAVEKPYS